MRRSWFMVVAAGALWCPLAAWAGAAGPEVRVPLPPAPRVVIPKPPAPKVRIPAPPSVAKRPPRPPRRYEYFPQAQVYFDPGRQLYFFLQAGRWMARGALPPEIRVRIGPPVYVELETEQPYEYHEEVVQVYPVVREDRHRGYRAGFDDGYERGYDDGYQAGYRAGFEEGYREGWRQRPHGYGGREKGRADRGRKEDWGR